MSADEKTYVLTNSGKIPFSVGYLSQALISIGLPQDRAYRDAYALSIKINNLPNKEFTSQEIMEKTIEWYQERAPKYAERLAQTKGKFKKFKPMVILLGGVTGIGKSTLAGQLGANFEIKSILGTDLIREVLRVTISEALMPTLHASSYMAHRKLDTSFLPATSKSVLGFEEQARAVTVGIESAIEQALQDEEVLIIEGVHLVPGILKQKILKHKSVVFFMLSLKNEEVHRERLKIRETKVEARGEHYLKYFSNIRKIHDYLITRAEKNNIKIIDIEDDEEALTEIINSVWDWKLELIHLEEEKSREINS
ncbi:MAG: hypothetical protein INQ03_20800 [Candidatus Heimdallarchaeota archaeon]|nr:hypothetical protein [Candidatus Heimdallarchaeota archaeon]